MNLSSKVNFVLCWHMHQPWYQQGIDGEYQLPWVYLHATKDYSDMATHLENHPNMQLVVNFAPILLEQIDDYAQQLQQWLTTDKAMRDPLLNILAGVTDIPDDVESRYELLTDCQRAHAPKMIDPYPAFSELLEPVSHLFPDKKDPDLDVSFVQYMAPQYFHDVLVWYHLSWLGYSLKQTTTARRLMKKGSMFTLDDRRELLKLMSESISAIIPRYRALAQRGQIELSMTPYCHPIIPLLNDLDNMSCAQPEAPHPESRMYPGGAERSRWHMQQGLDSFKKYFGIRPEGVWLSEGGISEDAVLLLDEFKFSWTASGEGVWRSSCHLSGLDDARIHDKSALFHSYKLKNSNTEIFFRDDGLSDLVGFEYAKRNAKTAVDDFVQHLVNIADFLGDTASDHVVSVILDGENAWEYYEDNGYHFLDKLYEQLSSHERIQSTQFSKVVNKSKCETMKSLCAGSWVYGSFSTWIGSPDKNHAWDLLVAAKRAYDEVIATGKLSELETQAINKQLAVCEGSDWFWWFGDHNPSDSVSDFDLLFRLQLKNLYSMLGIPAPDKLEETISRGHGSAENAGTMRRNVV